MKKLLSIIVLVGLILVGSGPAGAGQLWGTGSPDWSYGSSGPSAVIFKFDTSSGVVSSGSFSFETSNWMWISGLADSGGKYLYASHNSYDTAESPNTHDFKIAKIDRNTGAVLSDTFISGFLGQTYSQVNALDFVNGKLYGVENATSGSAIRGYAIEVLLDAAGDVVGATKGAYVGPYPDAGLDYHDGLWYATSWGYTPPPKKQGSIVYTSPDIMNVPFTKVGTGNSAVQGIGMIDGWEFDSDGNLFAVTWYGVPASATAVYSIDLSTRQATVLYDLSSQLPASIISLDGLSEIAPDTDGDGVPDSIDNCGSSDLRPKVDVNGDEPGTTTINNTVNTQGCSLQDFVNSCASGASNHGQYVSCISGLAHQLYNSGAITKSQRQEMITGAAKSNIGK